MTNIQFRKQDYTLTAEITDKDILKIQMMMVKRNSAACLLYTSNDRIEFNVTLFLTFLLIAPGVYYLNLFKPDLVFDIEYFFKADVESASPSEWFYSCCKISAYVSLMIGPAIAAFMLIFNVR